MMWGEVRCGEIFSKNCEVRWGAEALFFEKCSSLVFSKKYEVFCDFHIEQQVGKPQIFSIEDRNVKTTVLPTDGAV